MKTQVTALCFGLLLLLPAGITFVQGSERNCSAFTPPDGIFPLYINGINWDRSPFSIISPRHAQPVIVEPGNTFSVVIEETSFDNIYILIETAYETVVDGIYLLVETAVHSDEQVKIMVRVPFSTPVELYNLTVIIEKTGKLSAVIEPRAVSVVDNIADNFTFIHISDFHIGDPRGIIVNPQETIQWKAAKKTIQEVNLMKPDFVVITGDLTFGQLYPFEYSYEYRRCYDILQQFDVPTFLVPGNHDGYIQTGQDGLRFWETYFGSLYYSFNYGSAHFVGINSYDWPPWSRIGFSYLVFNWGGTVQQDQLEWIEDDMQTTGNATFMCMMMHHNPLWETTDDSLLKNPYHGREDLLSLIEDYNIDLVLAGHVHRDNVTVVNNSLFLTTTTCASDARGEYYWGYRLVRIEDNVVQSYNYREPHFSIPSYHLNITYINEGKTLISNDLDMNVTVQVTFTMPVGVYTSLNGTILMSRSDNEHTELYVLAELPAHSQKEITVNSF